jgi:hypothetical protein
MLLEACRNGRNVGLGPNCTSLLPGTPRVTYDDVLGQEGTRRRVGEPYVLHTGEQ